VGLPWHWMKVIQFSSDMGRGSRCSDYYFNSIYTLIFTQNDLLSISSMLDGSNIAVYRTVSAFKKFIFH
jgi:hypothetical protein